MRIYPNREEAGQSLGQALRKYADQPDVLVLALPRGGVPVARIVAESLHAPLDVVLVRKLGVPWDPELAFGAIAEGDARVVDEYAVRALGIRPEQIERVVSAEQVELARRASAFRGDRPPADVKNRTILVVDDGLATGSTMLAAVRALRQRGAGKIVVAVPVGPPYTCAMLAREADEVLCLDQPEPFEAVGAWYADFRQVTDDEVRALLPPK